MCEIFGVSSAEKIICNSYLKAFFSNAVNHPDGWGIARFENNSVAIEKEPISAIQSNYLENRLTDDIEESVLLAHIRKASIGNLCYKNTHPFAKRDKSGRLWTLIHNGTIYESDFLDDYKELQNGSCDSERVLLYLLDQINAGLKEGDLTAEERFHIFDRVMHEVTAPHNKVNLLAYDGELFYIHTNHPNSLYCHRDGKALIFCTRPLNDGEWLKVPLNTAFACRDGVPAFCGEAHDHLFLKEHETAEGYDSLRSVDLFYI